MTLLHLNVPHYRTPHFSLYLAMHTLIVAELKSVNFELLQTSTKLVVVNDRDTDVIDNLIRNPMIQEIVQYRRVHMCEEITMRWTWGLFLCVCTPYVLTLARSIWRIIFKKTKSPKLSVVMFVSTMHPESFCIMSKYLEIQILLLQIMVTHN